MTPWIDLPMAILDTETTGLNTETAHVWEIGIRFRNGPMHGRRTQTLVRPPVPIPDEIVELCKLSPADLKAIDEASPFGKIAPRLLRYLDRKLLVAYNGLGYDIPLLRAECAREAFPTDVLHQPCIDPHILARELLPNLQSRSLTSVAEFFGCASSTSRTIRRQWRRRKGAHRALADVEMTDDVLVALSEKLPDDLGDLLAFQAQAKKAQDADRERYSYWLRSSRKDPPRLRLACGKYCGAWLHNVDPGYLRYLLKASPTWDNPLPEAVRVEIDRALRKSQ